MFLRRIMGKASDAKRAERRERSEEHRQARDREKRSQSTRSKVLFVIGVLALAGVVILGVTRRKDTATRVWSAEHGHWHDR